MLLLEIVHENLRLRPELAKMGKRNKTVFLFPLQPTARRKSPLLVFYFNNNTVVFDPPLSNVIPSTRYEKPLLRSAFDNGMLNSNG